MVREKDVGTNNLGSVVVRLRPPIAEDIASRGFMPDGEEFWVP